jgi:hypothetical protein
MDIVRITRKELYDKVWSEPLIKLAKVYHLSDNGLRKICKKHDIPLPIAGHWAKVQNGHKVTQRPFTGNHNEQIIINVQRSLISRTKNVTQKAEVPIFGTIIVPNEVQSFHPVVRSIKQRMKEKYRYYNCAYHFKRMRLSKENWDRGMRIYDTALRAIEKILAN